MLRIQWLRARARVNRWSEEITLLLEEIRRVNAFLTHEANKWNKQTFARSVESPELAEGLTAYAYHQAHISIELCERFVKQWSNIQGEGLGTDREK